MTLMTAPDHPPLTIDETRPTEPPNSDSTAKLPPNYPRQIYWTLNILLLVLAGIFTIIGWGALREVKADREERSRVEFCEDWAQTDFPTPDSCQ
jgi:hypothetical protein